MSQLELETKISKAADMPNAHFLFTGSVIVGSFLLGGNEILSN